MAAKAAGKSFLSTAAVSRRNPSNNSSMASSFHRVSARHEPPPRGNFFFSRAAHWLEIFSLKPHKYHTCEANWKEKPTKQSASPLLISRT
jgi:hypothetical protein